MPIYTGSVKGFGSGNVSGSENSTTILREYVDIGDVHLRKVRLPQYLDDTLQSAQQSGEIVQLSTFRLLFFPYTVVAAIKLENNQVRKSESMVMVPIYCLAFLILGLLLGGVFSVVLAVLTDFGLINLTGNTIFSIGMLSGVVYGFYGIVAYLKARYAL